MKFRDPKTGKVFDDICSARKTFCGMWCTSCPLIIAYGTKYGCESWVRKNEEKAARLMGYEVLDKEIASKKAHWIDNADSYICSACGHEVDNPNKQTCGAGQCMFCGAYMETKEDNMDKQDKPRLAEVLGVEVGERFQVDGAAGEFWVESDGGVKSSWTAPSIPPITRYILYAINHPESIIRAPRLTESEIAIMRTVGANWASRDDNPETSDYVDLWRGKPEKEEDTYCSRKGALASITKSLFPSVKEGDCIPLEEVDDG